jgi:hypothetical protein
MRTCRTWVWGWAGLLAAATAVRAWDIPDPEKVEPPVGGEAPSADPRTYLDAAGFRARADRIVQGVSSNFLGSYRKGWFGRGGDPGKYTIPICMARLIVNPEEAEARQFMNDDRTYKEHYHFAAVNWARFYPLFAAALTPETRGRFATEAGGYTPYLESVGTENHKIMWLTSANVLPSWVEGKSFARRETQAALAAAKEKLRAYVKGLYAAGQGEWDSSTYLAFDLDGMLNVYDFAKDPETRLLARAALDWYVAGYALKYTDGVYTAPNQRGFASGPAKSVTDGIGWLWWGCRAPVGDVAPRSLVAIHAATSAWRPNGVLCRLARREVTVLPFEQRNAKPNYYYGQGIAPVASSTHESVYVTRHYTLGSLWNGHGSQITRFQIAASTTNGAVVFTGGHPRQSDHTGAKTGLGFRDGNGRYDQSAQCGPAFLNISVAPEDETEALYSFFAFPVGSEPRAMGDWLVMQAGATLVGLLPVGERSGLSDVVAGKGATQQVFKIEGRVTAFVVETADTDRFAGAAAFAEALKARTRLDASALREKSELTYTTLDGRKLVVRYQSGKDRAGTTIDGKVVEFGNWPVYGGPCVRQEGGVLTVNDGKNGFRVDFSGERPVYAEWKP